MPSLTDSSLIGVAGAVILVATAATVLPAQQNQERRAMPASSTLPPLLWQAAAGRRPARFLAITVRSITTDRGGLLGIGQSPSLVGAFPDARIVEGAALETAGLAITARVPRAMLPNDIRPGQRLVLGLVDDRHVICFLSPPPDITANALPHWAEREDCGSRP